MPDLSIPPQSNPAAGERRAVRGFSGQFRVAAELIYDALLDGDLQWVKLADPDAGRVDDVQIARIGRLDAYQIKWGEYEDRVSLRDLITPSGSVKAASPSPIAQLADGWARLSTIHPSRPVSVHFLMRASASNSDGFRTGPSQGPIHLQSFLRHAFAKRAQWHSIGVAGPRTDWKEEIEAFEKASGLEDVALAAFFPACHLDLGWRGRSDAGVSPAAQRRREDDIDALAHQLFALVGGQQTELHLDRLDLLRRLGWQARFDLSFRHDFPVDERLYQPVEATVEALDTALRMFNSGYLAVVGPPGAGKSTTLTQVLRYRPHFRVVRYYAYVRGDTAQGRGEANAFLHDLCLSIRGLLPPERRSWGALPDSREELIDALGAELGHLADDWRESGIITAILIDGLDHIEREQSPVRSLLHELPLPSTIPEGVVIILGTQETGLQSQVNSLRPIRAQLEAPGRKIAMAPLGRNAVFRIAETALPGRSLIESDHDEILRLSAGHPLALTYLLKRLNGGTQDRPVSEVLAQAPQYEGDIEQEYAAYWDALTAQEEVCDLLAKVARIRGAIELDTIAALAGDRALRAFVASARHYFTQETSRRWSFFHNSFRQYLVRMTSLDAFGRRSEDRDRRFHYELADVAAALPGSSLAWDSLYHLSAAGDQEAIAARFSAEEARAQYLAGRLRREIEEDIDLAFTAAGQQQNGLVLLRAMLALRELHARDNALEDSDLPALTLQLAAPEDVAGLLFRNGALTVSDAVALEFVPTLLDRQELALARQLFEMAEPLSRLNGTRPIDAYGRSPVLELWVRAAIHFRSTPQILLAISQVEVGTGGEVPPASGNAEMQNADARLRLLGLLSTALARAGRAVDQRLVEAAIKEHGALAARTLLGMDLRELQAALEGLICPSAGRDALEKIMAATPPCDASDQDRFAIADYCLRLNKDVDSAETYVAAAGASADIQNLERSGQGLGSAATLVVRARVLAMLGRSVEPVALVPDGRPHDRGAILFHRLLAVIGEMWGARMRGELWTPDRLIKRLQPALTFFQRSWRETQGWGEWHVIEQKAASFYRALLQAVAAHGLEPLKRVMEAFDADWARKGTRERPGWRLSLQIEITLDAFAIGGDADAARTRLARLAESMGIDGEAEERVGHFATIARAWAQLGDLVQARSYRMRMLETAFGIGHEDDQMTIWLKQAEQALIGLSAEDAEAVLRPFITALPILHQTNRGDKIGEALGGLIGLVARISPRFAGELARWLLEREYGDWDSVTSGLLWAALEEGGKVSQAALIVAARMLIPFERTTSPRLLDQVRVMASHDDHSSIDGQVDALSILQRAVETRSYVHCRRQWLDAMDLQHLAPSDRDRERPRDRHDDDERLGRNEEEDASRHRSGLVMQDGTMVSRDAMLEKAGCPAAFRELLQKGARAADLRWQPLLDLFLANPLDQEDWGEWVTLFQKFDLRSEDWFAIGARVAKTSQRPALDRIRDQLVSTANPQGWYSRYDGATRLIAAEFLASHYGDEGRAKVFDMLVTDVVQSGINLRGLLGEFDRLKPLYFSDLSQGEIWHEINAHLVQLSEVREGSVEGPPGLVSDHGSFGSVLIGWLNDALESPVLPLAAESRRALIDLMRLDLFRDDITDGVTRRLAAPTDTPKTAALTLLLCAFETSPEWVANFSAALMDLIWAPSMVVRRLVHQILALMNVEVPRKPPEHPLPIIYSLELPATAMPETSSIGEWYEPGQTMPDTTDPYELSRLYIEPFQAIAKNTSLSIEAMTRRLYALAQTIASKESWSQEAEAKLMRHLEAIELKVSYRRPRSEVIRQAFGRVIAELVDAGHLSPDFAPVDQWLVEVDPILSSRDPVSRPEWIKLEPERISGFRRKEWVGAPEEAIADMPIVLEDGSVVLAEWTRIEWFDHDRPKEMRASLVGTPKWPIDPDEDLEHRFFAHRMSYCGADYPFLRRLVDLHLTVIKGGVPFDRPFLALYPPLAFHLAWQPSDAGLFQWKNADGEVMAESIWWQDGNRELKDARGMDERTAEGWAVVVTARGYAEMEPQLEQCIRVQAASRATRDPPRGTVRNVSVSKIPI